MIQINPLQSYIDGGPRAAITSPPSASLVFDLPGKATWVKGVKLKGTDHTYTFSHDNYITLTNTPDSNESEDIKIGVNTSTLKSAIDTTYGVVSTTANGLAPKFTSGNKQAATAATTYYFLGWTGTTLKWYQAPFRNIRINSETTDRLGVNSTDPLIISSGNGISVTWDSTNKKIIITNTKPDINHNTDTKVAQNVTTQDKNYAVILKGNDSDEGSITTVNFSTYLKFNPSTKQLISDGEYYANGNQRLAHVSEIPTSLKNPYSLTLKANGTILATYDGSSAKEVNFTYTNVGAASASHNHDGRYLRYFRYTTSPNADSMEDGWHDAKVAITNTPTTNHGTLIQNSYNGTPFQIFIPDASYYIYKRYKSGSIGGTWTKIYAGYADSAGSVAWNNITGKPSSYTPSAHTHAWNSLTHSSTTENQAILTNGSANGWKLYTLNISGWNNAANNAHSHSNKSVLDGITSTLVSNWNTAYNFVNTISGTDTDKVINKWDEIVNFLAGITEDNKLNTLLNSKLSVYKLADNTDIGAIKNNGIYYSTSDASSGTLINSPFNNGFTLINITSLDNGDDLRRSRLAFNAYGEVKISNDRGQANTAETWYNILTSNNSGISGSTIKLNGTSITVYSSSAADGRYVKKTGDTMSGALTIDTTNFGALVLKRNDDTNGASIQFRGKSNVYGYIGLNNSTKDKQFLRWNSDTSKIYTILDTSSTYVSSGKGIINGTTITQVDNATNATNSTNAINARKLVNWYSARPTSLNTQFGDGSLRIFYATSSTTEGKPAEDSHILHLAWDNNGGWDTQVAVHTRSGKVSTRAQNSGTWQPWKTLAFTTDIPTALKNPHTLTISLNGTSQGPYDGSAAKNINITPSSIGASPSSHTHSYLPLSGGTMTGNITYKGKGTSYIGNGENDAANGVGGALNNLVISSWNGISFTTSCSGQTYTNKNAVSINCRNGYVYANTFVGSLQGNASTAIKLQTSRNLWGNSFNGTANISGTIIFNNVTSGLCEGIQWTCGDNDFARIKAGATGSNAGYLEIATADDGSEPIYVRQYTGVFSTLKRTLTLLDGSGNTILPGSATATGFNKSGSSNSYVLLGGGSHKAISDFMLKTDELSNNLTTISKSLTVTQAWMDTGIKNTDLPANGTYIVQVSANNSTDYMWSNYWSGIMSWYTGGTNDNEADEIILHRAGHAYHHTIYLRTIMTTSSDGRHLRLQIAADTNLSTAVTYTFKFKRVI